MTRTVPTIAILFCLPAGSFAQTPPKPVELPPNPTTTLTGTPPKPVELPPNPITTLTGASPVESGPSCEWFYSDRHSGSIFGADILLGQQTGIRPHMTLFSMPRSDFVVEGFYGGLFTKFGSSEGAGAGVRWRTRRGGTDSVLFGPGVDVMFNFNDDKAVFLAPTIDLAWHHCIGERASLQLGINAGVGIGLSGGNKEYIYNYPQYEVKTRSYAGKVSPLISAYLGLRY